MKSQKQIETQRLCAIATIRNQLDVADCEVAGVVAAVLGWVLEIDDPASRQFGRIALQMEAIADQADAAVRDGTDGR